jgi:hypothetical protein
MTGSVSARSAKDNSADWAAGHSQEQRRHAQTGSRAGIWPAATPVAEEVDFDFLASQFKLSGGNIKNVALSAAFLAASECEARPNDSEGRGGHVTMAHLFHATQREYQKMGKHLSEAELCGTGRTAG